MLFDINVILIIKYIISILIIIGIILTPTYLARITKKSKYDSMRVRFGSWIFCWSFVGWLFALILSGKK
ncbi:MAG: hypothetical protein MJ158_00865 [Alphaproteobacteria bacterium]|nr:hypothetical protein [Alphaproteobacteria bacterium]